MERDEVALARALFGFGFEALLLAARGAQRGMTALDAFPHLEQSAESVEQTTVALGTSQALRFVLARDLQSLAQQLGENRHRNEAARHPGAAAALAADAARDDEGVILDVEPPLAQGGLEFGSALGAEHGFHARFVGAVAHGVGRGPTSRQQRQRSEHDRFARARLPGERAQAGTEFDLDLLDHGEVHDSQRFDHRAPQCSFERSTSKRERCGGTSSSAGCSERRTTTRSPSWSDAPS